MQKFQTRCAQGPLVYVFSASSIKCACVVFLCHRDLWELRAEFSRLSSSLLSVWASPQSAPTLPHDFHIAHSTTAQPLSSTQGPLSLDDLNHEERESTELKANLESETLELRNRSLQGSQNINPVLSYFKYSQYICNDFAGDKFI